MQAISTVTGLPAPAPDGEKIKKIRKCEHGDVEDVYKRQVVGVNLTLYR